MNCLPDHSPPISDYLPIALRAFAAPTFSKYEEPKERKSKRPSKVAASQWTLIFDTETGNDAAQSLRFGTYQVRDGENLHEAGIFYEPDQVSDSELETLRTYADTHGARLMNRDEFADQIFFGIGYDYRATIVGFNLPFDISRIAIHHGSARGKLRGGFTFQISRHKYRPYVQVKHISRRSAFIQFAAPFKQTQSRSERKRGHDAPVRRGHFVDARTLASALFARSFSLADLGAFLQIEHPKLPFDEFGGPITPNMADYAMRDVQSTWECYQTLAVRYAALGLEAVPPAKIYSEASIGKAYMRGMGIEPWRKQQPDIPRQMLANIMATYFGGRSEVRIRRELRQVILCDFLSMYPTVCTLMGLWRFVIASRMDYADATAKARSLLARVDLDALQSKAIWSELATLVRVKCAADIIPVRAAYSNEAQSTIGLNHLSADQPLWFTLADCIASKLLTGKAPEIVEAIAFSPGTVQPGLRPVKISGKNDYLVDPARQDFFKRAIELRQETKRHRDAATGRMKEALNTDQNALKIAANATSYGIYMEVNVEDAETASLVSVHNGTGDHYSIRTAKAEKEGPFFHPLLASLITGAARLMLAITERQVTDQGLEWAFCDTDSMAIAKTPAMPVETFNRRVRSIVDWFAGLNPYDFDGSILQIEAVNHPLSGVDELAPLHCWAISAKRYALFNIDANGLPIIRKASAHGLGHLLAPYTEAPTSIPKPQAPLAKIGVEQWQHDLWWRILSAALSGHPDQVNLDYHAALNQPAISQYAATTPRLLRWFKGYNRERPYGDQVKPFGFLTALSVRPFAAKETIRTESRPRRKRKVAALKPIAPYDRDPACASRNAFDRETGNPIPPTSLKSYWFALAQYHLHPESKFLNADFVDRGTTHRRHIQMTGVRHIGKEANKLEEQMFLGVDEDAEADYGISPEQVMALVDELRELAKSLGRKPVANAIGISVASLSIVFSRKTFGSAAHVRAALAAIPRLKDEAEAQASVYSERLYALRQSVEIHGLRGAARLHGFDPSNLRRMLLHQDW